MVSAYDRLRGRYRKSCRCTASIASEAVLLSKPKAMPPDVPVVMITAHRDAETKRKSPKNSAEVQLTKPIDFGTLHIEIRIPVERAAY